MSYFKSSENIVFKKEAGPDRSGPDNQFSSVTLNELAMKVKMKKRTLLTSISHLHKAKQSYNLCQGHCNI